MELAKLVAEKERFEDRMRAVIQGELNTFIADGGIMPAAIYIDMLRTEQIGKKYPVFVLGNVEIQFGL